MMCEHVGEPCGCRIAAFLERRSFPKLETLSLRGAGLRAVPDAVLRLPRLRELDLSRNELLRALPDDLAALGSLEALDVTETALEALPPRLFDLPRLRRVAADAELLVAPAGWTVAEGRRALRRRRRGGGGVFARATTGRGAAAKGVWDQCRGRRTKFGGHARPAADVALA